MFEGFCFKNEKFARDKTQNPEIPVILTRKEGIGNSKYFTVDFTKVFRFKQQFGGTNEENRDF